MPRIDVHRPFIYMGCARKLKIRIDGINVGHVLSNKTASFDVSPGVHSVVVNLDWLTCTPLQEQVADGEVAIVKVSTRQFLLSSVDSLFYPRKFFILSSESVRSGPTNYPRPNSIL